MTVATYAAAQSLRVLPRTRITRAVGRLVDLRLTPLVSRTVVGIYARAYDVNMAEAQSTNGGFESFDAFFTRRLRDGQRPICAAPGVIVSPSDGNLVAMGTVESKGQFHIKGKAYRAEDLVGDADDARRYEGGQFAVIYLSPRDYHRVHSPVEGHLSLVRSMPGELYPVNAIGERHVRSLFARNRRVAIVIDSSAGHRVTVVMVSAMIVGRVTVTGVPGQDAPFGTHVIDPACDLARGDEIGIFHLGSTAVVFIEPNVSTAWRRGHGPIRLGEAMGDAA